MRVVVCLLVALVLVAVPGLDAPGRAASGFASPAFARQWQAGESVAPNFWGPLATAREGQPESYGAAPGGTRTVQYFDKGRMELGANGNTVTSGLLGTELIRGQIQTGDAQFAPRLPPAITIAGDPNGGGPTYADIGRSLPLQRAAPANPNAAAAFTVSEGGEVATNPDADAMTPAPALVASEFDTVTRHNVPLAFAEYRARVGLSVVGQAITEPFRASVRVGGVRKFVTMQVFERRSLTYTPENPLAFQVEMGNIGRHYHQWRYSGLTTPPLPPTTPPTTPPGNVVRTITDSDNGQTITLRPGDRVQLLLSTRWNWQIETSNPAVFAPTNAPVILLSQGIYEAQMPGRATLSGTGRPAGCVTGQPCIQIIAEVSVEIVVG